MKRFISLFLSLVLLLAAAPALAHERWEHDEELEYVLFRDRNYADSHPTTGQIIKRIEDAAYLAIDQFNENGKEDLKRLNDDKIPGIPTSLDEFKFSGNYAHRQFTHRGWNVTYDENAHWPIRQTILKNTVRTKLFSSMEGPLAWLPWSSERGNLDRKAEAFSVLVYYVHVLGDHIEAEKYTALAYVAPLANYNDRDNPGVSPDLMRYLAILFADQTDSEQYKSMIQDLEMLAESSNTLYHTTGGIREEQFPEYHQKALNLLETLATYVPDLLKKEEFFHNAFYK